MDALSTADLRRLIDQPSQPSLTLYMPTQRSGPQVQQNSIRLRNLLHLAEQQLDDFAADTHLRHALLDPLRELLDRPTRMQAGDGLAVFASQALARILHVPLALSEQLLIDTRLHVTPLIPLLSDNAWAILALSKNRVRLLRYAQGSFSQASLPDTPHSLAEAMQYDEFEKQHQFHPGIPGRTGERGAIFHGQGDHTDVEKDELRRYLRLIDAGVCRELGASSVPLVLAGVEYLVSIYREVSAYPNLVGGGVLGNPDETRDEDLWSRGGRLIAPRLAQQQRAALDRYRARVGTGTTSADLYEIATAAQQGRVETLLVAAERVGDESTSAGRMLRVFVAPPEQAALLDSAVADTLICNAQVFACDALPGDSIAVALFRY